MSGPTSSPASTTTTTTPPGPPAPPQEPVFPPRFSQLWFAEKLSQKKDTLTIGLITLAAARLLWTTQVQRRRLKGPMSVVAPQLVVWAIFWPTALVCLRSGVKWGDRTVAKAGLDRPADAAKRERAELDGDERKDV